MSKVKQVLVVEDEVIVADDLRKRLIRMGYNVPVAVSSGKEAIEKANENLPDLVLMDIVLHGDMDGIEAAEKIHSNLDIPVVYLTAYADEKTLQRARITEPYGYIIKPFKERELQINLEIALYKYDMEKRLKASEQWLSAAINSIGDAVIATDPAGEVKLINPIAEALTGWKQEEAMGQPLKKIFNIVSEDAGINVDDPVSKVLREGIFYGLTEHTVLISNSGIKIPVDIIGSPIKDEKNHVIGVVVVFYDIMERRRIEKGLSK